MPGRTLRSRIRIGIPSRPSSGAGALSGGAPREHPATSVPTDRIESKTSDLMAFTRNLQMIPLRSGRATSRLLANT